MHKCKTCYGDGVLLDGTPCPDCILKVYHSKDIIKLCGNCENSSGRGSMHCLIKDIIVEYSWNACSFYHVHSRYISYKKRRKYQKHILKLRSKYEEVFRSREERRADNKGAENNSKT